MEDCIGTILVAVAGVAIVGYLIYLAVYAYGLLVVGFFTHVAPWLVGAGGVICGFIVLGHYLQAIHAVLWGARRVVDVPDDPATVPGAEPAYKAYFFRKWWPDYRDIVKSSFKANAEVLDQLVKAGMRLFTETGAGAFLTWPIGVVMFAVGAASALGGAVLYLAFGLVHLLVMGGTAALALLAAGFFRGFELLSLQVRKVTLVCPHGDCQKRLGLPVYHCPGCAREHRALLPGTYGTFQRRCMCGRLLPTLFLFGRNHVRSSCPQCRKDLTFFLERNIHLPLVGGPSSGKSTFLATAMAQLQDLGPDLGLQIRFPSPDVEKGFQGTRDLLNRGNRLDSTHDVPPAFQVEVSDAAATRRALYIHDVAGEIFETRDRVEQQEFFKYRHGRGLLFLVDPLAIEAVQTRLGRENLPQAVSPQSAQATYESLEQALGSANRKSTTPVAVVLTKCDECGIGAEIRAGVDGTTTPGADDGRQASEAVRKWLGREDVNLLNLFENHFTRVRYFACSALGRSPDVVSSEPFRPEGVVEPLLWLLRCSGLSAGVAAPAWRKAWGTVRNFVWPRYSSEAVQASQAGGRFSDNPWGLVALVAMVAAVVLPEARWASALLAGLLTVVGWRRAQLLLGQGAWLACLSVVALLGLGSFMTALQVRHYRADRLVAAAATLSEDQHYEEAHRQYQAALGLEEGNAKAREGLARCRTAWAGQIASEGNALLRQEKYGEAKMAFLRAMDVDPKGTAARDGLREARAGLGRAMVKEGDALMAQGRHLQAKEKYRGAKELDPQSATAEAGLQKVRDKRVAEVVAETSKAITAHRYRYARIQCEEGFKIDGNSPVLKRLASRALHGDVAKRLLGTWRGKFSKHQGALYLNKQLGDDAHGVLLLDGGFRIAVTCRFKGNSRDSVEMVETAVLQGSGWSLGANKGAVTADASRFSGTGRDSKGSQYGFAFARRGGVAMVPGLPPSARPGGSPQKPSGPPSPLTVSDVLRSPCEFRFFESGQTVPSRDQRRYATRFSRHSTRFVSYEIRFRFGRAAGRPLQFTLQTSLQDPSGKVFRGQSEVKIEQKWQDLNTTWGAGRDAPAGWLPGRYRMRVVYGGRLVRQGSFTVI